MYRKSDFVKKFLCELREQEVHKGILLELNDPETIKRLHREAEIIEVGIENHYEKKFERNAIFFIIFMCFTYAHVRLNDIDERLQQASINAPLIAHRIAGFSMFLVFFYFQTIGFMQVFYDAMLVPDMDGMSIQSFFKHNVLSGMLGQSFFKYKLDGVEASYKAGQVMQEFCEAYNLRMDNKYECTILRMVMTSPVNVPTGDVAHYYELAVLRKMIWEGKGINPLTNEPLGRDFMRKLLLNPYETVDKGMQEEIFEKAGRLFRSRHANNPSDNADEPLALAAGPL